MTKHINNTIVNKIIEKRADRGTSVGTPRLPLTQECCSNCDISLSRTHSCVEANETDVQKLWEGFGRSVRSINTTPTSTYLLQSKWPYKCTDPCRFVEVVFVWNLPAEKLGRLRLLLSSNKGSVVTAGRYMCGIFSARLIKCVTTQDWRFREKLSAFLLLTRLSLWHIRSLCLQRSFSRESPDATEATENKTRQFNQFKRRGTRVKDLHPPGHS